MQPEIELGPLTLQTFGLMLGLGFVVAGIFAQRYLKELGRPADWAYEMVFAAIVGGIVGARLWAVIENWDEASKTTSSARSSPAPGWSSTAACSAARSPCSAGPGAAACSTSRRSTRRRCRSRPPTRSGGSAASSPATATTARRGTGPWAMAYPDGTVPTTEEVHPTPVYETLTMGLVAWFLWRRRHSMPPGGLFALYLVLAGAERFLVEFLRRNDRIVAGLTLAQLIALAMVAAGGIWLVRLRSARGVPAPARS